MPQWRHTLRLADVFHSEELPLDQKRDIIVRRIKQLKPYKEGASIELHGLVDDFAEVGSTADFDEVWNELYDEFDRLRVWVVTR